MGAIAMLESVESSIRPFLYLYVNKQRLFYQKCEVNNRNVCTFHRKGSSICIATRECLLFIKIFNFWFLFKLLNWCKVLSQCCRFVEIENNNKNGKKQTFATSCQIKYYCYDYLFLLYTVGHTSYQRQFEHHPI